MLMRRGDMVASICLTERQMRQEYLGFLLSQIVHWINLSVIQLRHLALTDYSGLYLDYDSLQPTALPFSGRLHEIIVDYVAHQFGIIAQVHFFQDAFAVGANGIRAQFQDAGNSCDSFGRGE